MSPPLPEDQGLFSYVYSYRPKSMREDFVGSITISTESLDAAISRIKTQSANNSTFNGQEVTTFAGQSATKLSFTNNSDTAIKPVVYLVKKTDLYIINGEGSTTQYDSIVKTILSTFQFTPVK